MAPPLLTDDEIAAALERLPHWDRHGDKLRAEFTFSNFSAAFGFMAEVAIHAERLFHHPEWSNVYNRVVIELTTHDSGGITGADIELAEAVSQCVMRSPAAK